jgi:hypothetical protein
MGTARMAGRREFAVARGLKMTAICDLIGIKPSGWERGSFAAAPVRQQRVVPFRPVAPSLCDCKTSNPD